MLERHGRHEAVGAQPGEGGNENIIAFDGMEPAEAAELQRPARLPGARPGRLGIGSKEGPGHQSGVGWNSEVLGGEVGD